MTSYDKALERARKLKSDYQKELDKVDKNTQLAGQLRDGISALEMVFPELRESEDERIRKELVETIKLSENGPVYLSEQLRESYLTWLEKQKEQKTDAKSEWVIKAARRVLNNWLDGTDCPDVSGDFTELEYAIREYDGKENQKEPHYTKRNALFDKCVENCDPEVMKEVSDKVDEMLGKPSSWNSPIMTHEMIMGEQKEQKPVEIHIDNPNIQKVDPDVEITTSDSSASGKELLYVSNKSYDIGFRDGVASVKPAEWSEEDIKKIRSEEYTKGFNDAAFVSKLKEWSVEDEDRIRQIERIAQEAGCTQKLQEEIHDWLKSLRPRPSWKPSEEQMKGLKFFLDFHRPQRNAGTTNWREYDAVESLYKQLKKLI